MSDRTHGDVVIQASAQQVVDVIADLARYPEWSDGVTAAEVLETFDDGRPKSARLQFARGPVSDSFVVDYTWNDDTSVTWTSREGSLVHVVEGKYTVQSQPDGSVHVTYDLQVELSIPMIGTLRTRAERLLVKTALQNLKKQVEKKLINDCAGCEESQLPT